MANKIRKIETWIFDLDNTLYPATSRLFDQISLKMTLFIMKELHLNQESAYKVQKIYFKKYGTTLRGLMIENKIDPLQFLNFVHDINLSAIPKNNTQLNQALQQLPGRKVIFTNGSKTHANNITNHLGIRHHFDSIFDIVASNYIPKPNKSIYKNMIEKLKINPKAAVMVEDMACNLLPAADLGMTTVWIKSNLRWAAADSKNISINYTINDLTTWLLKLD